MILIAIPIAFVGITVSPLGAVGRWLSLGLFIIANLLLWGAMLIGVYVNVFVPWRLGQTNAVDDPHPDQDAGDRGEP